MSKEITKAFILQQIQDKFKLRELVPETFAFSETVIPTYNIEGHLKSWLIKRTNMTISASGAYNIITVPQNERWHISGYSVVFISGAYTVAGVYVSRKADLTDFLYLDLKAAQNVAYTINLPKILTLDWGDELNINADGYTSTGTLRVFVDYVKEELR